VKITDRTVSILLSDDGRAVLGLAGVTWGTPGLLVEVIDTDDMGVWVRLQREQGEYTLWVRWDYVLTIEVPSGVKRVAGLTP